MKTLLIVISSIWLIISEAKCNPIPTTTPEQNQAIDYDELCKNQNVYLNFSNVYLQNIGSEFIASTTVTCLSLRKVQNEKISSSAFDKLPNLTFLDLSDNNWQSQQFLQNGSYPKLKSLVMDSSAFTDTNYYYRQHTYEIIINGSFPELEKLYLRNNNLVYIKGTSATNLSKLTHLYLSNNKIQQIRFLNLRSPIYYQFEYRANEYNDNSWLPKSLKYLDLDSNKLDQLLLEEINNLEFLSVQNNMLQKISFTNLSKLKYLSLNNNKIERISKDMIKNMPRLEYFNLANNKLISFDGRIIDFMPVLQNLTLSFNSLTTVPEIQNAPNLTSFSLRCNQIKQLSNSNFNGMSQLQVLYLDNNVILEVESGTFNQVENLEVLSLGRNNLMNFPEEWMMKMQKLRFLQLENNLFTNVEALELSDSPSLKTLFLQNNPLKYLRVHSFDTVPENVTIELDTSLITLDKC